MSAPKLQPPNVSPQIAGLIESKSEGSKKILAVRLDTVVIPGVRKGMQIRIEAVNRGTRPITVDSYGLDVVGKKIQFIILPYNEDNRQVCSPLPMKLGDGDKCVAIYPRSDLEIEMKKHGWDYPLTIRTFFHTYEGIYYSEELVLPKV